MTSAALRKLDRERLYNILVAVGELLGEGAPYCGERCRYCAAPEGGAHYHGCAWQALADAYNLRLGVAPEEAP